MAKRFALVALMALTLCAARPANAALQFDVFIGYDGVVPEANWFPVTVELFNDGPGFTGTILLKSDQSGGDSELRMTVELPTNTRKRVVIPNFGSGGSYTSWDARLYDERGKVVAEQENVRATKEASWNAHVMGALSRTLAGTPRFPKVSDTQSDLQPTSARFQPAIFPDSPIALEGLDSLYLNSERALDLDQPQIDALRTWINGGGHLIFSIENPTDVTGTPWLEKMLPCSISGVSVVKPENRFHRWLTTGQDQSGKVPQWRSQATPNKDTYKKVTADTAFQSQDLPIANCVPRDGNVILSSGGKPVIVAAPRGRGTITVLAFSAEKEPLRSWKNRSWFWAHLAEVPGDRFHEDPGNFYGNYSVDGVFGGMIDSRQVRKLPVSWLLLLLVVYLLVIGPLDQWWLKKINKQMLTWITFPCYVIFFSALIYWIGFMLRAGESEWNELNVVDVFPLGEQSQTRGRSYISIYSPSNKNYPLAGEQTHSTLRGEFMGTRVGGSDSSRAEVIRKGDGFSAEVFVPVWTSQLYVADWSDVSPTPVNITAKVKGSKLEASIENETAETLADVHLVYQHRIFAIGEIPAGETSKQSWKIDSGAQLKNFVNSHAQNFEHVVTVRQQAFGDSSHGMIDNLPRPTMAISFLNELNVNNGSRFITPKGMELSNTLRRGDAILLAWQEDTPVPKPIRQFNPARSTHNTLLRIGVNVEQSK